MTVGARIITFESAKKFFEGPEVCREYLRNESLWFGVSEVQPGDVGALDPGHQNSWEVFYCVTGEATVNDGSNEFVLRKGDALAIPPTVPHTIHNRGTTPTIVVWAGGPGETP